MAANGTLLTLPPHPVRRCFLGRCFAREGFHRTTMQDIVAQTGLSAGAIYRYFPAKEDIVAAIAAEHRAARRLGSPGQPD
jgi:hypothetical protein